MDLFGDLPPANDAVKNGEILISINCRCLKCASYLDPNSASLFDDIPPAADKSQSTGKRKVVDEENDESKRPKVSTQCKT